MGLDRYARRNGNFVLVTRYADSDFTVTKAA
jgi:hypothetical protein